MKKFTLKANKRQIVGKKVKKLRINKILPANIYGKNAKSEAIQLPVAEFNQIYQSAGQTNLIDLDIDGKKQAALIQNVQPHPLTGETIHADFYLVNLKEKVKTKVPIVLTGHAPAVEQKLGLILELADEVEVEALPANLPEKISLDISTLKALGDTIKVSDIKLPDGVMILTAGNTEIVKIGALVTKEAEKLAAEEAAVKAAAVAQTAQVAPQTTDAAPATAPAGGKTETTPVATKQPETKSG